MDFLKKYKPQRPMVFPYTFTAKIVQFPWEFYVKNNWVYRYYIFGVIVCIPIFNFIHKLSNSEENKAQWAATQFKAMQKERENH